MQSRNQIESNLGGIGDLKTGITAHLRSRPPTEGEEFLQLYLADREKTRLGKMSKTWEKLAKRTRGRRSGVRQDIAKLERKVGQPNSFPPRTSSTGS